MRKGPTPRQEQILGLVATGLGDKEIAVRLGLSTNTVRTHLQRHYREHGLHNRAEAAVSWATFGAPEPGPAPPAAAPAPARTRRILRLGLPAAAFLVLFVMGAMVLGGSQHLALSSLRRTPVAGLPPAPTSRSSESSAGTAGTVLSDRPTAGDQPVAAASDQTPPGTSQAPLPSSAPLPTPLSVAELPQSLSRTPVPTAAQAQLALVNADRMPSFLPPLAWDPCLASVAAQAAQRVAARGNLGSTGGVAQGAGCGLGSTVENVGYWSAADDAKLNEIFLANPAQRVNIMGSHRHLGAAWAISSTGVAYLAVEFA